MKRIVVLLIMIALFVIVAAGCTDHGKSEQTAPTSSYIPEGFQRAGIPVYVCDKNPFDNPDAVCWLVESKSK